MIMGQSSPAITDSHNYVGSDVTNGHYSCKHIEKMVMLDPCASTPILLKESTFQTCNNILKILGGLKQLSREYQYQGGKPAKTSNGWAGENPLSVFSLQEFLHPLSVVHTSLHLAFIVVLLSHPSLQFTFYLQLQQAVTSECNSPSPRRKKSIKIIRGRTVKSL